MTRSIHHTDEIIAHERKTERSLAPFGIVILLLALGLMVAMIALYR